MGAVSKLFIREEMKVARRVQGKSDHSATDSYCRGAHRSYSSRSAGSKHVTSAGSARTVILRAGVPYADVGAEGMGR